MRTFKDTTTGEIWTEEEIRELWEQVRGELDTAASFADYIAERITGAWLEEVQG